MIGQDTEFFAFDTKQNRCIPAHLLGIAKTKTKLSYHGSFFRDGFAIEFNGPPCTCRSGLWENLGRAMEVFKKGQYASSYDDTPSWKGFPKHVQLITDPIAYVDLTEIRNGPEDLKILGCNPTWDPYTQDRKEVSVDPLEMPFRTSGAHLHFGFASAKTPSLSELGLFAKYCDLVIGLPFAVIFDDDKEFLRRSLYGSAGEFRDQTYPGGAKGFEYRVLSSRLYNHPGIFHLFVGIFKYMLDQYPKLIEAGWNAKLDKPLQKAINTGKGSKELLEEFSSFMGKLTIFEPTGMRGLGYIPKDWAAAIVKLSEMRKTTGVLNEFQMWLGQKDAHWGWSEYNDHKYRSSTVGHLPFIKEEPWLL